MPDYSKSPTSALLHAPALPRSIDESLDALASIQHGTISRLQSLDLGATPRMIQTRVRSRRWIRVHPGVYRTAGAPDTWLARAWAAHLARPDALISHQAAARLHRMRYVDGAPVSISEPRPRGPLVGVEVHRPRRPHPSPPELVAGLPVTSRAATIVDLAAVQRPSRLIRIVDDQLSSHLLDLPDLIGAFNAQARRGKKGSAPLRQILVERAEGVAASRSELEHRFRERVVPLLSVVPDFEFLPPWREHEGVGRADVGFSLQQVLAELDGRRWHLRDQDYEADRIRDQEALEHGWRPVRYTYRQISEEPERVARNLNRILKQARPAA